MSMTSKESMAAAFERFEQGLLIAALLNRLGVKSVTLTRAELAALAFQKVHRKDDHDGSISFRVIDERERAAQ